MRETPSAMAFSSFDPGSAPTTSAVVFFDRLSETCPPAPSIKSRACWRDSVGSVPVTTYVWSASGRRFLQSQPEVFQSFQESLVPSIREEPCHCFCDRSSNAAHFSDLRGGGALESL